MSPQTFNAQLAEHKLESIRLLLAQAKTGSDADRIRAASAIVRIPFMQLPNPRKAAPSPRGESPPSPPLPLPAGEGRGEGESTQRPQLSTASDTTAPSPDDNLDIHPSRDPETVARLAPCLIRNAPHPMPPQTPMSSGSPITFLHPPMDTS